MPLCTLEVFFNYKKQFWDCPENQLIDLTDKALEDSDGAVIVVETNDKFLPNVERYYNKIIEYRKSKDNVYYFD